jgi:hypothetical protein
MPDATFVVFVPSNQRSALLAILQSEDTRPLAWREKRAFLGSEIYLSGPPVLARRAHAYIAEWVLAH